MVFIATPASSLHCTGPRLRNLHGICTVVETQPSVLLISTGLYFVSFVKDNPGTWLCRIIEPRRSTNQMLLPMGERL
jgi:hypothetical protein